MVRRRPLHTIAIQRLRTLAEGSTPWALPFGAQVVAVCREHGVAEILTEDRDFARFGTPRPVRLER